MLGTLLNTAAVVIGGTLGAALRPRPPDRVRQMGLWGVGLVSVVVGVQMSLSSQQVLIVLGGLLAGGLIGELAGLHDRLNRLGETLQARLSAEPAGMFAKGFVTASLVFCVGPMTVFDAIRDGLSGDDQLLALKSVLDGFAALAFAASMGWGVLCASLSVLGYQGALTLGARLVQGLLTEAMLGEMTATGGTLVLAIGLNLLAPTAIRVADFLPALLIAPAIVAVAHRR
jgi:uncharacterized membrane protein YqgA involved in biofilm formation